MYQKSVMHVRSCVCFLSLLDRDGNENVKRAIGLDKLKNNNNNSARESRFFVHFFAVTAGLRRENAYFHILWRT